MLHSSVAVFSKRALNNKLYTTCPASNNREKKGSLADILEYLATKESHIFLRNLWRQKQSWPETQHHITVFNVPPCLLDMQVEQYFHGNLIW